VLALNHACIDNASIKRLTTEDRVRVLIVLTENGMTNALLGSRSGASKRLKKKYESEGAPLPLFLAPSQLNSFIDNDLREGPLRVIEYVDGDRIMRGFDAEVLLAVCAIWFGVGAVVAFSYWMGAEVINDKDREL
jgi:hypothetical protein